MKNAIKHKTQFEDLQSILASVCYLEQESKKAGMPRIAYLFRKLISDVEKLILQGSIDDAGDTKQSIDSDLYRILLLLQKFSSADKFNLESITTAIEEYEAIKKMVN